MSWVRHNVRLSPAKNRTLISLAEEEGISSYAMLGRIIDRGLVSAQKDKENTQDIRDIALETGRISARMFALERVAERTLFTSCAAYIFARDASLKHHRSETVLTKEALAAFERQRAIAEDHTHEPR